MNYNLYLMDIIIGIIALMILALIITITVVFYVNIPVQIQYDYAEQLLNIFTTHLNVSLENVYKINNNVHKKVSDIIKSNYSIENYKNNKNDVLLYDFINYILFLRESKNIQYYNIIANNVTIIKKNVMSYCNTITNTFNINNFTMSYAYFMNDTENFNKKLFYEYNANIIFHDGHKIISYFTNNFINECDKYDNTKIKNTVKNNMMVFKKQILVTKKVDNYYVSVVVNNIDIPIFFKKYIILLLVFIIFLFTFKFCVNKYNIYKAKKNHKILISYNNLLNQLFPKQIINNIFSNKNELIFSVSNASILFADIVGFTEITHLNDPTFIVNLLNDLFDIIDKQTVIYNILKIKTIGDCYMCANGIFTNDNTIDIIDFGLSLFLIASTFNVHFRIGIHSGPVIAGVLHGKCPIFDVWGDTVNIASRLENKSKQDNILVSENTFSLIIDNYNEYFDETSKTIVNLKGIGVINAYFVVKK